MTGTFTIISLYLVFLLVIILCALFHPETNLINIRSCGLEISIKKSKNRRKNNT